MDADSTEEGEIQDEDEFSSLSSVELPQTSVSESNREKENCQENSPATKRPNRHKESTELKISRKACCRKRKAAHRSLTPSSDSDSKSPNRRSSKSMRRRKDVPLLLKYRRSRKPSRQSERERHSADKSTSQEKSKQLIISATVGNSLKERLQGMFNKSSTSSETKTCDNDDDDIQILVVPKPSPIVLDITGDTVVCLTKESQVNTELEDEDYLRLQALQSAVIKNKAWREQKHSKMETTEVQELKHDNVPSDLSGSDGQMNILTEEHAIVQAPEGLKIAENQTHSGIEVEEMDSVEDVNIFHIPAALANESVSAQHKVANIVEVALVADTRCTSKKLSETHITQHQTRSSTRHASPRKSSKIANYSLTSELPASAENSFVTDCADSYSDSDSRDLSKMIVLDEVCSPEPSPPKHMAYNHHNSNKINVGPNLPNSSNNNNNNNNEVTTKSLFHITELEKLGFSSDPSPSELSVVSTVPAVSTINEHNSNILSNIQPNLLSSARGTENKIVPPHDTRNLKIVVRPKSLKSASALRHSSPVKNPPTSARNSSVSRNHPGSSKTAYSTTKYTPPHFEPSPTASTWTKWTSNRSSSPTFKVITQRNQFVVTAEQNKRFVIHVSESSDSEEEEVGEQFPSLTRTIVNDLAPPVVNRPKQDPNFAEKLDALLKQSRELQSQKAKENTATSASSCLHTTSANNIVMKQRQSSQEPLVTAEKQTHLINDVTKSSQIGNINVTDAPCDINISVNAEIGCDYSTRVVRQLDIPDTQNNLLVPELQMTEALLLKHRQTLCDKLTELMTQIEDDSQAKDYIAQQKLIIAQAQNVILKSRENIMEANKKNEERLQEMNVNRASAAESRDQCRMVEAQCHQLGSQLQEVYRIPSDFVTEIRDKLVQVGAGLSWIRLDNKLCRKSAQKSDATTAESTIQMAPARSTCVKTQGSFANDIVKSPTAFTDFKAPVSAVSVPGKTRNISITSSAVSINSKPNFVCATTVIASDVPVGLAGPTSNAVATLSTFSMHSKALVTSAMTATAPAMAIAKPATAVSTHPTAVSTLGTAVSVPVKAGSTGAKPLGCSTYPTSAITHASSDIAHTTSSALGTANNTASQTLATSAFAITGSSHISYETSHANIVATHNTDGYGLATSDAVLATPRFGHTNLSIRPALAIFKTIEKHQLDMQNYAFGCPFEVNGACTDKLSCPFYHGHF